MEPHPLRFDHFVKSYSLYQVMERMTLLRTSTTAREQNRASRNWIPRCKYDGTTSRSVSRAAAHWIALGTMRNCGTRKGSVPRLTYSPPVVSYLGIVRLLHEKAPGCTVVRRSAQTTGKAPAHLFQIAPIHLHTKLSENFDYLIHLTRLRFVFALGEGFDVSINLFDAHYLPLSS